MNVKFEDEFPSLKGKHITPDLYHIDELREHCLDKRKVKKILNKLNMQKHHPIIYKELKGQLKIGDFSC